MQGPLKVPNGISNDQDVLFLSDILPTGYFGADIANVQPGDDVAVFGAGPVGYFATMIFWAALVCALPLASKFHNMWRSIAKSTPYTVKLTLKSGFNSRIIPLYLA